MAQSDLMNNNDSTSEKESFDGRQWEYEESDRKKIERTQERGAARTIRQLRYNASDESKDSSRMP